MNKPTPITGADVERSSLVWSVVIAILLVVVKSIFEHTAFVEWLEKKTYEVLQHRIVAGGTRNRPDILVVNIASIKPESWTVNGHSDIATPRQPIQDLVDVLSDAGARSIGIDVDFSPKDGKFRGRDDPRFFEWCLERTKEKHSRIFLG